MAVSNNALPFGLREVKVTPINTDGTYGTRVKLPAGQTFSFTESEDFEELRGDDRLIAERGAGPLVDWDLEAGGISLNAYQVITGGVIEETGVDPDVVKTYTKDGYDQRPYFRVEGRAISDSGGDIHCVLFRCRANGDISGEFADGSFWVTSISGRAYPPVEADAQGKFPLYKFQQNQSETELPA